MDDKDSGTLGAYYIRDFAAQLAGEAAALRDGLEKQRPGIIDALVAVSKDLAESERKTVVDGGKLVVAIDTSGSIFGDSKSMTMAVEEILRITDMLNRKYTGSAIEVLMCDVDLHVYGEANTKYEMQKILKRVKDEGIEMQGGGGTNLLPIWEHVLESKNEARKKGKMPPAGLIVVTDTETMNIEKITDLYYSHKFNIPTVILTTSDEIESCKIWRELSEKCSIFMMADIDKIKEKERHLRQAAEMQER